MLAVVTGASGLLGGNLAIELLAQGHRVRATRRGATRVDHLADFPIEWVEGDLADEAALTVAFRGADAVFHCAAQVSIRRVATPAMVAANVDGTRRVLAAARAAGAGRLIHCSTVGAVGLSEDGRPCTEESRWNFVEHGMDDGYVTTKHQSELLCAEAAATQDLVTVNPTYMLGPHDARPSSGKLIIDVVHGKAPGYTLGINNFVDVRDVARGMILAHQRGARGQRYILGNHSMTYQEILARIARVAGVPELRRQVPRWLGRLVGWFGDLQEALWHDREPLLNSVTMGYAYCTSFQFSSDKARRELGYTPGPIEPAIADAIAWFRGRGML